MASKSVQEAVKVYEEVVRQAAAKYEQTLREAEVQLRAAMSAPSSTEPQQGEVVQVPRETYDQYQKLLPVIEKIASMKPELLEGIDL